MSKLDPNFRINLEQAQLLLLDDQPEGLIILSQIVRGFGAKKLFRAESRETAIDIIKDNAIDLLILSSNLKKTNAYEFVSWIRRSTLQPNAFAPALLVSGHTQRENVERARDCGANMVLAKPVSPASMLKRILWIAREQRPFVQCDDYIGPDRRFRRSGPPEGVRGRRHDDP